MEKSFIRVRSVKDILISSSLIVLGSILVALPTGAGINIAGFFMKLLHIDPGKKNLMTENELRTYVDVSHEDGVIESEEKVQGIAPGQFAVIYDKEKKLCYGSGIITGQNLK